jgi:hypothetical protein
MSNIVQYFGNKSFEQIKEESEKEPYHFKVTDENDMFMVSTTAKSDLTNPLCREMSGIILEKESNRILHYSLQKAYEGINEQDCKDSYTDQLPEKYEIEIATEGSIIKTFYHNNEWKIATSKNLNATFSKWGSDKSFKEIFLETLSYENLKLDDLDKSFCYSWIIQHPENKISGDISVPFCIMINKVNLETLEVTRTTDTYKVDKKLENILEEIQDVRCTNNYIVYLEDGRRIKLESLYRKKIKNLLGNHSNMKYSFIHCIKNGLEMDIIEAFPTQENLFNEILDKIHIATLEIHRCYMEVNVLKNRDFEIPYKYNKTIKQLHWQYRQDFNKITKQKVYDTLINLPIKVILWVCSI